MSNGSEIEHVSPTEIATYVTQLRVGVQHLLGRRRSPATIDKYRADAAAFERWCAAVSASHLPAAPDTVVSYIAHLSGLAGGRRLAVSTIQRKLAAIGWAHTENGYTNPCRDPVVSEVMKGTRNELGAAATEKRGITTGDITAAVEAMDLTRPQAVRDRALLLIGFAAALRRSELAALKVDDIEPASKGVVVIVRRSKRDQQAKGAKIPVLYGANPATCPVRALRAWLNIAGIAEGPVFRPVNKAGAASEKCLSAASVAMIVKRHMAPLGHDPNDYAGHSLRRGAATTASRNGADDRTIQRTTRHASAATLAPYIEEGQMWDDPASGYLGL